LLKDVLAVLFLLGWCAVGIVKTAHDVTEYRAQQAAAAVFNAEKPEVAAEAARAPTPAPVVGAPYDPALGRWLMGEAFGYLVTLAVVAIGSYRAGRRSATVKVKWIAPTRRQAAANTASRSGGTAMDRLSVAVWADRVARLEKERA
jgi:hypothetical protein